MKKYTITLLIISICFVSSRAQFFEKKEFYPGIKSIYGKYYNGSGGGGYWSIEYLDSLGRPIKYESYRKRKLLSINEYIYNSHNDKLFEIYTSDRNSQTQSDTICYDYKYSGDRIIYQKLKFSDNDSIVMQLIENKKENTMVYQHKSYYIRPSKNDPDVYERKYTFNYADKQLTRFEDLKINVCKDATYYEYYPDGKLKRRRIVREWNASPIYQSLLKSRYTGGPGSDDMYYEYKFDKYQRVKTLYHIVNGKKYKIANYKYKKN